ncbi:MAG: CBS domain-containing protein [Ardenticatenaceae bacterium]|nr:CBS domain-containing protein [Ardenticatenaceae bacterium]
MRLELVKDWMSRDVVTGAPTMGLLDADSLMREHKIRRLPVVENGRLVGIVTYGDIREARPSLASAVSTWEMNHYLASLNIGEIMTQATKSVSPEATIGEAADMMLTSKISGLPVVDAKGVLVGIITESDIFRMVAHHWKQGQDDSTKPYTHYDGK